MVFSFSRFSMIFQAAGNPVYKREVPPVCIPRATGDKGVKRISPHTLGTRDRANNL